MRACCDSVNIGAVVGELQHPPLRGAISEVFFDDRTLYQ
jgi:hypothetical protein